MSFKEKERKEVRMCGELDTFSVWVLTESQGDCQRGWRAVRT
jgi:hypothetical protein